MNGYLLRKCRSEQQLMNELSKLLASKDYASKKMSELLRELSFFYVSPTLARVPHSVLKDLVALLTHLKPDKKDDLRVARLVLCLLARIVEQFELRYQQQALASAKDPPTRSPSFDMSLSMASGLLKVLETQELTQVTSALAVLPPRQVASLKLYGHLTRVFHATDALILKTKPLVQKSPVWGLLTGDKKAAAAISGKKEFPAQLATLAAAFHCVRFHVGYDEQCAHFLEHLLQAAFLPNAVASRHAAAALLQLFELSNDHAKQVTASFETFFHRFRPVSLRVGDPLATIYLLRLCGQLSRLPTTDGAGTDSRTRSVAGGSFGQRKSSFAHNLLDFSFDTASTTDASPPPSPIARQRKRLEGVTVSSALASRLSDLFLDILCAPPSPTDASSFAKAIFLATVEEAVQDAGADACIMKTRAGISLFEVAAGVLAKLLRDAVQTNNTLQLHRVVRAIQFTAESLDGSVLQNTDAMEHQPQFMDRITDQVVELLAHGNAFVACQSLRALVWLLPRPIAASKTQTTNNAKWDMLMARLRTLSLQQIQPESRQFIAESFYQRAVTNPSLHRHAVDVEMLRKCQEITLLWLQTHPCDWHAHMLVKIWTTALRKCLASMGSDVFHAINAVLDLHHHARHATAEHAHQWTLDFLARVGAAYVTLPGSDPAWFRALALRLTKHLLLDSLVSRRLTVAVLAAFHAEGTKSGRTEIVHHVTTLVQYLTQQQCPQGDVFVASQIHTQRAKDALGVQDLLVASLEPRAATPLPATTPAPLSPFLSSAFAGMF